MIFSQQIAAALCGSFANLPISPRRNRTVVAAEQHFGDGVSFEDSRSCVLWKF
jgi:hypothetical protein